jgi:cold-inducible RNA-binding protein
MMEATLLLYISISVLVFTMLILVYVRKIHQHNTNLHKYLAAEFKKAQHYLAALAKNEGERLVPDFKLYVGNVDYSASEDELRKLFEQFGAVEEVNIPRDRRSGRPRGYGFITFADTNHAVNALVLDGASFKERTIQVNFAKERS